MTKIFFTFLFLIVGLGGVTQAAEKFDATAANAAYQKSDFTQAITLYEGLVHQGLRHWALEYNLGDAYYKSGQLGKAITCYLRAFRLKSSDRDLVFNLNLAMTRAGDPLLPTGGLERLFWRLYYGPSINVLTIVVLALWLMVCLGTAAKLWRPVPTLRVSWLLNTVVVLLFLGAWTGSRIFLIERAEGVVISQTAEVRSGPNATYPASFTVPEGRRVLILEGEESVQGWVEIGVPHEGLKGWIEEKSIDVL